MRTGTVVIRDRQWQVWVAESLTELARGLSGVGYIPRGTGVLSVFRPQPVAVNTQLLRFPIDIVFIDSQLKVVGVSRRVQPGMLVAGRTPVQYVLKVNSTETAGIEVGDLVGIAVHQSPGLLNFIPQLLTLGMVSAFIGGVFGAKGGRYKPPIPPDVPWEDWLVAARVHAEVWDKGLAGDEEFMAFVDHIRAYYPDDIFKQISMVGASMHLVGDYGLPDVDIIMGIARRWRVEEAFREIFVKRLPRRKPPEPRKFPGPLELREWAKSLETWIYIWDKYLEGEDELIEIRVRELTEHSDKFVNQVVYAGKKWGPEGGLQKKGSPVIGPIRGRLTRYLEFAREGLPRGGRKPPIPPGVPWSEWMGAIHNHLKVWDKALAGEKEFIEVVDHIRGHYPDDIFKQISFVGAASNLAGYAYPDRDIAMGVAKKWEVEKAFREDLVERLGPKKPVGPREFPGPLDLDEWTISSGVWILLWDKYLEGENELIERKVAELVEYSDRFVNQVVYAGEMGLPEEMGSKGNPVTREEPERLTRYLEFVKEGLPEKVPKKIEGKYRPPIPLGVSWSDWRKAHEGYILVWHRALKGEEEPIMAVDYVRAYYPDDVFKQISLTGVMHELGPDYPPIEFPKKALEVARRWGVEEAVRRSLEQDFPKVVGPREPPVPVDFIQWIIASAVWLYYWDRYLKGKNGVAGRKVEVFARRSDRFGEQVLHAGKMTIGSDEWRRILEEMVFLKEIEL